MAGLPTPTNYLEANSAKRAIEAGKYLGFSPEGTYQPWNIGPDGVASYGKPQQGPYAQYGLGNDPFNLLADQYHSTQLLAPDQNPYAGEAAVVEQLF